MVRWCWLRVTTGVARPWMFFQEIHFQGSSDRSSAGYRGKGDVKDGSEVWDLNC